VLSVSSQAEGPRLRIKDDERGVTPNSAQGRNSIGVYQQHSHEVSATTSKELPQARRDEHIEARGIHHAHDDHATVLFRRIRAPMTMKQVQGRTIQKVTSEDQLRKTE
jgi:hypothetical protein